MKITTTGFGQPAEVEVPEGDLITFPGGIAGFEEHNRFAVLREVELAPFVLLQSLRDAWTAFVAIDLSEVGQDYDLALAAADEEVLGLASRKPLVLGIVRLGEKAEDATVNALAPVVINPDRRLGRQVIRRDEGYSLAEPLFAGVESGLATACGKG
ncbi:MAG: flagellar assembly protein FliW [Dehalococcoidales bacterium]|nr:flagellar assembly protein FliW [Dehalococcoidales bacterium]